MKTKMKVLSYKCNFHKDFLSNEPINTVCKICGNQMSLYNSRNYNPNNGLRAIKNSKTKDNANTEFYDTKLTVECPYCHSTNTKKITNTSKAVHTALFGIFSMSRNSKNYHCNQCGSDF